jgi:hypothetical protein
MRQVSAKTSALSTSIEAPPSTDVLALNHLLQKPETDLAVQLCTGKNSLNAFLYQEQVPSITLLYYSCGGGHPTA